MAAGWLSSQITHRQDWSPGLATFTLAQELDFVPGQFANLAFRVGEERVRRSYSIASAPGGPLEFFVTRVEGGAFTPQLFDLDVGDAIEVQGMAAGLLTLTGVPDFARDLWLVSTGTGLAPYISMLRAGVLESYERVIVVHGCRLAEQLAYRQELLEAQANRPGRFKYVAATTREESPPEGVLKGRLTDLLASGELTGKAGTTFEPERCHVMLCGNPDMVNEMMARLIESGLQRHRRRAPGHITIEKYW